MTPPLPDDLWFPVAPGITQIPNRPAAVTAEPVAGNSIPTPEGFDAANPGDVWLSLPVDTPPIYEKTLTPTALIPVYQEAVKAVGVVRLRLLATRYAYNLSVADRIASLPITLGLSAARVKLIGCAEATYTLSGSTAAFAFTKRVQAAAGSFASTGYSAGSVRSYGIGTNAGTYVLDGQNAIVAYQRNPLTLDVGSFALTGQESFSRIGVNLVADAGGYSFIGQEAGKLRGFALTGEAASLAFAGMDATLGPPPNVTLLLHMDGANGGTTFVDTSGKSRVITPSSGMTTSTNQVKFGSASAYAATSSQYLSMTAATAGDVFGFGSGDFTVETWVYSTQSTTSAQIYGWGISDSILPSSFLALNTTTGNLAFNYSTNGTSSTEIRGGAVGLLTNSWRHIAIARQGSTMRGFIDGVQVFSGAISGTIANQSGRSAFIMTRNAGTDTFLGYFDDFRVTKGAALYTSNFTPPTAALPDP